MSIAEKLTQIAENEQKVFDAGVQSEYDRFWDVIQNYGDTKEGIVKFYDGWNDDNFKPKYDIYADTTTFSNGLYADRGGRAIQVTDLRKEAIGVDIYWHKNTNFNACLRNSGVKYIGVVDMTNAVYGYTVFSETRLKYAEKVILPLKDLNFKNHGFDVASLEHITFENEFLSYVSFATATLLTHESLISILNALHDYANDETDSSSIDKRLIIGSTNLAKLTDEEQMIAFKKGWELQ